MTSPLLRRLRRFWLDVHLWLGVGLFVILAPLSLSGSILVWHDPLDRALHPARYAASAGELTPATLASAAQAAFAGRAQPMQLRAPAAPGEPAVATARLPGPMGPGNRPRTLNAWIDPGSGRVLETGEVARSFTMVLHRFHGSLMIPGLGRKIVGWLGWALFLSSATGLWLWWPRHGSAASGLRWRRGASTLFNLHHMVGFWTCAPLAALALTGVFISFPQSAHRALGLTPPPPRPPQAALVETPRLTPAEAVNAAMALEPAARFTTLNWPQVKPKPSWRVELKTTAGARAVEVDDATGAARPAKATAPRAGIAAWMRGVHDGGGEGLAWRFVITLAGATPTLLGVTGVVMWLRRRRRRRAIAPA